MKKSTYKKNKQKTIYFTYTHTHTHTHTHKIRNVHKRTHHPLNPCTYVPFNPCTYSPFPRYVCVVSSSVGSERAHTSVEVWAPLTAHITPQVQTVDVGGRASFNCSPEGFPQDSITWFKVRGGRGRIG